MPYEPINLGPNQHLGYGRGPDGGLVGLIFQNGTNKLVKHAVWAETDGNDYQYHPAEHGQRTDPKPLTPEQQILAEALTQLLTLAVIQLTPVVKSWWEDTLLPAAKSAIKRFIESVKARRERASVDPTEPSVVYIATKTNAKTAISEANVTMTKAEWAKRYQAMLDASQFSEEQRRLLSVARIIDAEGDAKAELTPAQFAERVQLKIEANPEVLEEENAAQVMRVIVGQKAIGA